ncbi:hypothetical protein [Clostridium vincentii]|uniref:Uncharacterized protein n=1 Tax=Clostridium vincentii TaxID=52704 RepID=A0A2T0BCB2_9CLOT|nr:hypothetical protein [Clostridium vincentii]PRR81447.1 hypothetical protein CLVI_24740 [Clostridium vincentii]
MKDYIDENEIQNSKLLKKLEGINLSTNITYIVGLSVFLTFLFLKSEKTRVIDQLNDVPFAENREKLDHVPIMSNKLLILALAIAIKANLESLSTLLSLNNSEQNTLDIKASRNSLIASILGFVSAIIVFINLSNASQINLDTILINPIAFL